MITINLNILTVVFFIIRVVATYAFGVYTSIFACHRDAMRYRVLRLYELQGHWPETLRGKSPGTIAWCGTHAGEPYTGRIIDKMLDEALASKYSRPIIGAAIAADSSEKAGEKS